jgi:ArsR family transcriptional regulator
LAVSHADELQKVFKTLSDPTRIRILRLLEAEELMVQELMEVLGMAQSRVSRHLAILREAGLLRDRRDGTYVFYRFAAPDDGPWREAWQLVQRNLVRDPTAQRDDAALARAIEARGERSRSFFDAVGPEWDALRKVFDDDLLRARAITRLVDPDRTVADIGTGTGVLAIELARLGLRVIGVDGSRRMLDAARAKIEAEQIDNIELREGDASALPLANGEVDAALAHMVLQYLPTPADAVREMARITKRGGCIVVVDFVRHHQEWMRHELGVQWQGFVPEEVQDWLSGAGLIDVRVDVHEAHGRGRDLPATFIASARR